MLHSLRRFNKDKVAQERAKILRFYRRYGEQATKEAFSVDRKLIHVWKKRLKDSVEFIDGISRYIISAIDSKLKFSCSSCYSYLSSRNSLDLLKKLEVVYPLQIKSIQTDNGAEFLIHQCRTCIVTFS